MKYKNMQNPTRMKAPLTLLLMSVLVSSSVFGQQTFSLAKAQEYALENAYSVRDKQMELEIARKTIKETASQGLPQVSGQAEHTYNYQIPKQPVPAEFIPGAPPGQDFVLLAFGVEHQSSYSLNVNQLIADGSYFVALMATRVLKENAANALEKSKIEIREEVNQTYALAIINQEIADLLEDNLKTINKALTENKALLDAGFVEEEDVDQLEILVNNIENNLENRRRQVKITKMLLKFQMGMGMEEEIELTDNLDVFTQFASEEGSILNQAFDIERNIDYRIASNQERASFLQMRNEQMSYLPKISAFLTHSQNRFGNNFEMFEFRTTPSNMWVPFTFMGARVNWDLFTGFNRSARVQKTRIELDRSRMVKDQVTQSTTMEYETAKSDFQYSLNTYTNRKRNVDNAKRISERSIIKYQQGVISSLDLNQIEEQYIQAQTEYMNAVVELVNNRTRLEKVLGNYNFR